ncbi:MAG: hypothetical protein QOE12_1670, partial [Mycobacterium sp.]|nr:hypothetical protein [Mycobacterium sp.]
DSFSPAAKLVDDWGYGNPGDPGAGVGIVGADPIGVSGPWQVDAYGQLVASGGAGFIDKLRGGAEGVVEEAPDRPAVVHESQRR